MSEYKQHSLVIILLICLLTITACSAEKGNSSMDSAYYRIAGELIVDAVPNAEMFGVQMFADGIDKHFFQRGRITERNVSKLGFPLPRIPQQVRVVWRNQYEAGTDGNGGLIFVGELAADHTIPVASRIPESALEEVRNNGGALRIKFRLKPDGVMLGWDIVRRPGFKSRQKGKNIYYPPAYTHTGGDFKEARPAHYQWDGKDFVSIGNDRSFSAPGYVWLGPNKDKLWEKGWYIDKNGKKIEVDY